MISAFGEIIGHPIVLNTSFNVRGEPIVGSPLDAVRCFFSTGIDDLAIGPFILSKTDWYGVLLMSRNLLLLPALKMKL